MYKLPLGISISISEPLGYYNDKYNYKIKDDFYSTINSLEELGFDSVDVDFLRVYLPSDLYLFDKGLKAIKKSKLCFNAAHMPINFSWCDIASPYPSDRKEICNTFIRFIKHLEKYGVRTIVFHPGGLTLGDTSVNEYNLDEYIGYLTESLNYISENVNATISLENMSGEYFMSLSEHMLKVLEKCPKVYTCVDTNHFYHEKAWDAIKKYKDRIGNVHISDYDFIKEKHLLPGEGLNDWNEIINALKEANYNYSFNYEVTSTKNYTFEAVKNNYLKLFSEYNKTYND